MRIIITTDDGEVLETRTADDLDAADAEVALEVSGGPTHTRSSTQARRMAPIVEDAIAMACAVLASRFKRAGAGRG